MKELLINNLLITIIIVFIIDYSGFVTNVKQLIWRLLHGPKFTYKYFSVKPFDCSFCIVFYTVFAFSIFNNVGLIITSILACCAAYLTVPVFYMMNAIQTLLLRLINKIK